MAFTNLIHSWRRNDISLRLKGRAILLYDCKTWPVRVEDPKRLASFDNRCLRTIFCVWWQHHVSNWEVRSRVLSERSQSPWYYSRTPFTLDWSPFAHAT
ncbi:unnamed protein product [Dicrocoelium dendriticum]|nr:unnamed protein product [Dicrocoelium dendriticum]